MNPVAVLSWAAAIALLPAGFAAALDRMPERLAACTACHGEQGRSRQEEYSPSIAGKPARYLFNQLRHFRDGRRQQREMANLLSHLSDDYLQQMAAYYSAQTPRIAAQQAMPHEADAALAESLVSRGDPVRGIPACRACHGEQLHGQLPAIPGLTGLDADYLLAQLGAWRAGVRRADAPDCMGEIARRMSRRQIVAVAGWLAAQPATVNDRAAPPGAQELPLDCATVEAPPPASPDRALSPGEYLVRAGNCIGCHTRQGGPALAGGRAIATPFGAVYSSNLTPDPQTGIGRWSTEDFWRALHQGVSADGRLLYPAFPYTHYSQLSRQDSDSMLAYLKTLAPVSQPPREHELRFPFNTQLALRLWRWIYFRPGRFEPDVRQGPAWNRGRYLVEVLGHCSACHGERDALGGMPASRAFAGGLLPDRSWYAPALQPSRDAADRADRLMLLSRGTSPRRVASGPMGEVVASSLQYLSPSDLAAMMDYLDSLPSSRVEGAPSLPVSAALRERQLPRGEALYAKHCADCHGEEGEGEPMVTPPLRGNPMVLSPSPANAIRVLNFGGFAPSTRAHPYPFGMPPFAHQLEDDDLAAVLSFIRNAWGNQASAVSPVAVARQP